MGWGNRDRDRDWDRKIGIGIQIGIEMMVSYWDRTKDSKYEYEVVIRIGVG